MVEIDWGRAALIVNSSTARLYRLIDQGDRIVLISGQNIFHENMYDPKQRRRVKEMMENTKHGTI
jgi:hypothetical protein